MESESQEPVQPFAEEEIDPQVLLEDERDKVRKGAKEGLLWGGGLVLLHFVLVSFGVLEWYKVFYSIYFVLGVVIFGFGFWEYRQANKLTLEDVTPTEIPEEFILAIKQSKPTFTWTILGCLIAVALIQPVFEAKKSIEVAGLVKEAVRQGEWWRLATCTVMHANFLHIWMNGQALISMGKEIEALAHRTYLPLVFFLSALVGSLFSFVLIPNTTSVGASGGLMGLVGFLAVIGYRRQQMLPPGFSKRVLLSIAFIAAVGLVGFALIDNAAHFGGLIAGVVLSVVLISPRTQEFPIAANALTRILGFGALLGIATVSLLAILKILSFHLR
jgi:membrane associated rhomboid family serine protease